jgi:hypothetical protein
MSPQIPPPDSSDSSTSPRTSKPSVRQQNLGITPMRHAEIRNAAEHLRKNPSSPQAMALLVAAVISAVERSIERRARGRQVRLQQRAVALVSTYADRLSVELRNEVRAQVRGPIESLEVLVAQHEASPYISEGEAARRLGVTVSHLLRMCEVKVNRQAMGWPRPLGEAVMFLRDALVAETAKECLKALPADEPWPVSSWPKDWRS